MSGSASCMDLLLHGGNRYDPVVRILEMKSRLFRLHRPGFQQDDARYDLQAIRNPVLKFSEQHVLLCNSLSFSRSTMRRFVTFSGE